MKKSLLSIAITGLLAAPNCAFSGPTGEQVVDGVLDVSGSEAVDGGPRTCAW